MILIVDLFDAWSLLTADSPDFQFEYHVVFTECDVSCKIILVNINNNKAYMDTVRKKMGEKEIGGRRGERQGEERLTPRNYELPYYDSDYSNTQLQF